VTVDEIADRLYALPPDEFTAARDEAARELRREGLRAEAAQVKELRRPTAAAAAVNQLVRKHRKDVQRFLEAAAALRGAQVSGKGDLARATKAERDALGKLVRAGGDQVRQSLQAAAIDKEAAAQLLAGRLDRELELRGFGTLLGELPRGPKTRVPAPKPKKPDDSAARLRLKQARDDLAEAKARERLARRELERAQAAVERAQKELTRLNGG
jgi:hypothetical protein